MVIVGLSSVVMGIAVVILLGTRYLPIVIGAVIMSNMVSCSVGIGNLLVDVIRPMLTWKSENEVMKQNMNVMLGMLVSIVMLALVAVPVVLLFKQAAWIRAAVAAAILLAELALSILALKRIGAPRLARLEP